MDLKFQRLDHQVQDQLRLEILYGFAFSLILAWQLGHNAWQM